MSQIEKLLVKLRRRPVPNDMRIDEICKLAEYYGCEVKKNGGKHSLHIVYKALGRVIPIPTHGDRVKDVYVQMIKQLINDIEESRGASQL